MFIEAVGDHAFVGESSADGDPVGVGPRLPFEGDRRAAVLVGFEAGEEGLLVVGEISRGGLVEIVEDRVALALVGREVGGERGEPGGVVGLP